MQRAWPERPGAKHQEREALSDRYDLPEEVQVEIDCPVRIVP